MLDFLKNPINKEVNLSFKQKFENLLASLFLLFMLIFISQFIITFIDLIVKHFSSVSINEISNNETNDFLKSKTIYKFITILILAPVIEECIFRLPLKINKNSIIIPLLLCILLFIPSNCIFRMECTIISISIKILLIIIVGLILNYKINTNFQYSISNKYFKYYFYSMAVLFGLLHITNFIHKSIPIYLYFLLPIYVLPQICLGIVANYIRMQNGIFWSILLHSIFNLPATVYYFLK